MWFESEFKDGQLKYPFAERILSRQRYECQYCSLGFDRGLFRLNIYKVRGKIRYNIQCIDCYRIPKYTGERK